MVYDIGNTLFFTGVVGLFFPLWVTREGQGDDATFGFTLSAAMAVSLVVAPIIGAASDQSSRRVLFLAAGTLACATATAFLASVGLTLSLILFAFALVAIYSADIIYNALLAEVSTDANRGTVGGLGVGIGYIGALLAVVIGLVLIESHGYVSVFVAVSVVMVLVAVPLTVLLKDRRPVSYSTSVAGSMVRTWAQLRDSSGDILCSPGLPRFLIARFWYAWSLYTGSAFAVLYATDSVGLSQREVQWVILVAVLVAVPCGLICGLLVDRFGPRRILESALLLWISALLLALAIPWLGFPSYSWWGVGVMAGIVVPAVWTADRPFLLRLTSPRYLGQVFGLRSVTSRLASIAGPFTWGYMAVTLDLGQRSALGALVICALISYGLLRGVSDRGAASTGQVYDGGENR